MAEGPNELLRRTGHRWPGELARQFTHPLALLLAAAAVLAFVSGSAALALAIAGVLVLNALVAFVQEQQAEHAVEALANYLPVHARVVRDGLAHEIDARSLVPGDLLVIEEGDHISADARIVEGSLEVDLSTLTGESLPAYRSAGEHDSGQPVLEVRNLVFSGTTCLGGEALAVVRHTGMRTELGRIAALSERVRSDPSPLEQQVKRVAWLIGAVALGAGLAFLPLGIAAGLSATAAFTFSIGLLVANVPEGLLPTITLALAVGVRNLAQRGAVVKRLSAVETLGSTTVICTDKTGTLTENRMRVTGIWTTSGDLAVNGCPVPHEAPLVVHELVRAAAACTSAVAPTSAGEPGTGDPTELALLELARASGVERSPAERAEARRAVFHFDPHLKRMSTVDVEADGSLALHTKGAPESLLALCTAVARPGGTPETLTEARRHEVASLVESQARAGLRILAVARRRLEPAERDRPRPDLERELCLLGFVAMFDPPRPEVGAAVAAAHRAGIIVHVVTGDHPLTAAEIARLVGIGGSVRRTVTGAELDGLSETELDDLLQSGEEIIFARSSPEAKLRIADALREIGGVVAMTGDGVNDAPALRRADIGVAMGRSGTDVAREAATMVLSDDNFATIVAAIEAGRRVYDNVRKFILYIFTHLLPELVPFLVFALSGGAIPLSLTVMQILAIDLGTDTLPALALSREPAEPGLMDRSPRHRHESVITRGMLLRSWGFLGVISAALVVGGFVLVLHQGGWHLHARTGVGTPLHHVYLEASTLAWLGIVACQVGAAFAVRTERAPSWAVGLLSNPALLGGITMEIAFALALVYLPPMHRLFGTTSLAPHQLLLVLPYPFVVWGADEIRKWIGRRRKATVHSAAPGVAQPGDAVTSVSRTSPSARV